MRLDDAQRTTLKQKKPSSCSFRPGAFCVRKQHTGILHRMLRSFPPNVSEKLGYYVYLYIDPRTNKPFYIGKGRGNRVFSHLDDTRECEKVRRLKDLKDAGRKPLIEILKYKLSNKEALLVEATAIDLIAIDELTNEVRGHGSKHGVRGRVEDIKDELNVRPIKIEHPVILINIARNFHYGMKPQDLYDATRSAWIVSRSNAEKALYALAVYRGIVREVYQNVHWFDAGQTMRSDADSRPKPLPSKRKDTRKRLEFIGKVATENVRLKYVGRAVSDYWRAGSQNPIRYVNPIGTTRTDKRISRNLNQ